MDAIDRAKSTMLSQVAEILSNARIRESFASFFVANASALYSYANMRPEIRRELDSVLKLKSTDPVAVYRGLLIQVHGAFELFVKNLSDSILNSYSSKVTKYSELDVKIRNAHAVKSAEVLAQLNEGKVNGSPYDFLTLQKNLGFCFADLTGFILNTDVFTLTMGNCTPDRLEKLFKALGLAEPFDDNTGKNHHVKKWANGAGARDAAKQAKQRLEEELRKRNDIAHGKIASSVSYHDVEQSCSFFLALTEAFLEKARAAIAK